MSVLRGEEIDAELWPNLASFERGYARQQIKVAVPVQDGEAMPKRAGSNQAVHAGAGSQAGMPGAPIERDGFVEHTPAQRRFDQRQRIHGFLGDAEGTLVGEPLKNLLNDRKAGDYFIELGD